MRCLLVLILLGTCACKSPTPKEAFKTCMEDALKAYDRCEADKKIPWDFCIDKQDRDYASCRAHYCGQTQCIETVTPNTGNKESK